MRKWRSQSAEVERLGSNPSAASNTVLGIMAALPPPRITPRRKRSISVETDPLRPSRRMRRDRPNASISSTPQWTRPSSGFACNTAICRSSFGGSQASSASRNARSWPVARAAPAFRALATPRLAWRRALIPEPKLRRTSPVASVEPSSTTTISQGGTVCSRALRIACARKAAWL
jgi:hypothetical protein